MLGRRRKDDDELPSPGTDDEIIRFTDEDISSYVEFPEDTIFMESVAHNSKFRQGICFVAVQRTTGPDQQPESYVYEISPGMTEAKHLFGPVATQDGTDVTVFGSVLSSDGILYLCAFNRNSLLVFDLKSISAGAEKVVCDMEIPDLASPNDVCLDPKDENRIYVAGGTFRSCCCCWIFANSAHGQVFEVVVDLKNHTSTAVSVKKGFNVLAGIEVVDDMIWVAQLYDIITLQQGHGEVQTRWKGNDGNGNVWLADNVDLFDDRLILCPAYSTVSEFSINAIAQRKALMSAVLFYYQVSTACMRGETIEDALRDPEVSLAFSNTYIKDGDPPPPIRLMLMSFDGELAYHFEIDLKEAREKHEPREIMDEDGKVLGKRHYFNEQVTHASHLVTDHGEGYVVCVSFEQPRILLLNDAKFREAMSHAIQE